MKKELDFLRITEPHGDVSLGKQLDFIRSIKTTTRNDTTGIYFLIRAGECVYVGQSTSIYDRPFRHAAQTGKRYDKIQTLIAADEFLDFLESAFVGYLKPEYNGNKLRFKSTSLFSDWKVSDENAFNYPEQSLFLYNNAFLKQFKDEAGNKITIYELKQMLTDIILKNSLKGGIHTTNKYLVSKTDDNFSGKRSLNLSFSHEVKTLGFRLAKRKSLSLSGYLSQLILNEAQKDPCP